MSEKFSRWGPADDSKSEKDIALYCDVCVSDDPGLKLHAHSAQA